MIITWTNELYYTKWSKLWRKKTLRILGIPVFTKWIQLETL